MNITHSDWSAKIQACLLGGAIGDAFGYEVEFESRAEILGRFGPDGLIAPVFHGGRLVVSDDTQMTLFTAEGLLAALSDPIADDDRIICQIRLAYLDWLETQDRNIDGASRPHGLGRFAELWKRRAPGTTCQSALQSGGRGSLAKPANHSKGCGGVMRVAPIGLVRAIDADRAFGLAARAAALTHGHPSGYLSAAAMSGIIRDLLEGGDLGTAVEAARRRLVRYQGCGETLAAIEKALSWSERSCRAADAVKALGLGWVGEEALAIGLFAVLSARDFPEMLKIAANHDGDSDSTASIAGQIWGAAHDSAGMPIGWADRLDVKAPLDQITAGLIAMDRKATETDVPLAHV